MSDTIPTSVLALIGSGPWRYPEPEEGDLPEAVYIDAANEGEALFSLKDAEALHQQGVFGRLALKTFDQRIKVSGKALSAFDTFLADVYGCWLTYRDRIDAVLELDGPIALTEEEKAADRADWQAGMRSWIAATKEARHVAE